MIDKTSESLFPSPLTSNTTRQNDDISIKEEKEVNSVDSLSSKELEVEEIVKKNKELVDKSKKLTGLGISLDVFA